MDLLGPLRMSAKTDLYTLGGHFGPPLLFVWVQTLLQPHLDGHIISDLP
jgi:hypothetical protein